MTLRIDRRAIAAGLVLCLVAPLSAQQADLRSVVVATTAPRPLGRTLLPPLVTTSRYSTDYSNNAIKRSSLDGSVVEVLVADVKGPYGLSFDADSRQLLWTSSVDEVVQTAPVSGGAAVTLPSSFEEGYAVALVEGDRKVVYGVDGSQVVKLSEDPQTGTVTRDVLLDLISPDLVHGLAVSADGTAVYLGDEAGQMSQKLSLATRTVTPLVFEGPAPQVDPTPPPLLEPSPLPSPLPKKPVLLQPEVTR
jgi:hypothetical protein